MTTNLSLGLLSKLPPELREKIYRYHLVLPESIPMDTRPTLSSFASHMAGCMFQSHVEDHRRDTLECVNRFRERELISCPSRLALLATSKAIYNEAVHIYYSKNHLEFETVAKIERFITSCPNRYRFLGEISFKFFMIYYSPEVFHALMDCQHLRIMRIEFNYDWISFGEKTPLIRARGMNSLRQLRGLKTLELTGKDLIYTDGGQSEEVDVNDPRAIGPILKGELTCPRK